MDIEKVAPKYVNDMDDGRHIITVSEARPPRSQRTGDDGPQDDLHAEEDARVSYSENTSNNFFSSVQWTPDGTSLLLASHSNHQLNTYVLPPDLLTAAHPELSAYQSVHLPAPLYALAIHPQFNLSSPSSCLYLASLRGLPIRLLSPFTSDILASYPLYNETQELWVTPHSLLFHPREPNIFYAGKRNEVCVFDIGRDGEGPYASILTGTRKKKHGILQLEKPRYGDRDENAGLSRGLVSALAMSLDGHLAIGTFTGEVGLVHTKLDGGNTMKLPLSTDVGSGVTGLTFHPDPSRQNYLVAGSRKSNSLEVFDVRNTNVMLASLEGRMANTQQRMEFDITEEGEVWAGGTDGFVRVWEGLGMAEGDLQPVRQIKAHGDTIGGIGLHPGGAGVLATCAGSRKFDDPEVIDLSMDHDREPSLKVWSVQQ